MNRQEQKELAVKAMREMQIDPAYIKAFKNKDVVTQFIRYAGYFVDENTECNLLQKIKEIEEETGICVFAVTQENFEFGRCFTMLCVSKYEEDAGHLLERGDKGEFYVFSYVYNADVEWCSEFGTCAFNSVYGGLRRLY